MENKKNKVLSELLQISLDRLRINMDFEKNNKMVYPEGSTIIKTILQIESELFERSKPQVDKRAKSQDNEGDEFKF